MHNHQQHDSKMMWLMMLACALPILLISIVSSGRNNPFVWAGLGIGLMLILHWFVMKFLHRIHQKKQPPTMADDSTAQKDDDETHPH